MCMGGNYLFIFGMATGLAYLGIVTALTIDNQLTVLKSDCYDRLAIGQRLNPKDVYKSFDYNTLSDCQAACTKEERGCRALSFGIGTKGNGTCELSIDLVKETADLKPIGTLAHTDFDLYVKKLDCSIVIDKAPHSKSPTVGPTAALNRPDTISGSSSNGKPSYEGSRPDEDLHPLENAYPKPSFASNYNNQHYLPPNKEDVHHVGTIVSVANGPNSYLHPVHEILVGDGPYNYGKPQKPRPSGCCAKNKECCAPSDVPPFRPAVLNYPYEDDRPNRPYQDYDRPNRPDPLYNGPSRPDDGYDRPNRPYDRPDAPYGGPSRPDSDYDRPNRPYDRPDSSYNGPSRPGSDYDEPNRPYDRPDGANRPGSQYDKPIRPYDRPNPPYNGPNRPDSAYDRPNGHNDRPDPPYDGQNRPYDRPDSSYDRPKPSGGPDQFYDKPYRGYDRPDRPYDKDRPYDLPFDMRRWDRKPGSDYDRPSKEPFRPGGYDDLKPHRPYDKGYDDPPRRPFRPGDRPYDLSPNSVYYDRPLPPKYGSLIPHPDDYDRRPLPNEYPSSNGYDRPPKRPYQDRPNQPDYPGYNYDHPPPKPQSDSQIYGNDRPGGEPQPGYQYEKPSKPSPGGPAYENGKPDDGNGYHYDKPSDFNGKPSGGRPYPDVPSDGRPYSETPSGSKGDGYGNGPPKGQPSRPGDPDNPNGGYDKPNVPKVIYSGNGSIISTSIGPHGEEITSILTELKEPCFRRVLAGKRVARRCVRRSLSCETVEQCQRECADEKYFICEGFNYRLDPSGRGKGDCELLDLPLSQLDIGRDLYPDHDTDYYERDRNAASANCRQWPNRGGGYYPSYGGSRGDDRYEYYGYNRYEIDRRYDGKRPPSYKGERGPPPPYGSSLRRPADRWSEDEDYKNRPFVSPDYVGRPGGNRRGDFSFHHHSHSQDRFYHDRDRYDHQGGIHYLPAHYNKPPYVPDRYNSYEPYLPPKRFYDTIPDRYDQKYYSDRKGDRHWGLDRYGWGSYGNFGHHDSSYGYKYQYNNRNRFEIDRRNYYLPPRVEPPKAWGLYGGTYGNGGDHYHYDSYGSKKGYEYWGLYKYQDKYDDQKYFYDVPPPSGGGSYLPSRKPIGYQPVPKPPSVGYLPRPSGGNYLPLPPKPSIQESHFGYGTGVISTDSFDNSILPAEPRRPPKYDFLRDECSLRNAAGFRLHKRIVKKFFAVPNIYECEMLCFKEKEFVCTSYAYRYTISLAAPTDNCYLSNRNYKELDYYTDLEPDRDFDIYTMNNRDLCEAPIIRGKDNSECFWRVRSGQRLAQKVVRDSLTAKSIVECQLECLRSARFTCRAFSFRYGSPVIGGVIDNCQLTDWPYFELDPKSHFVPEPGFEIYERGSFGHGCEPDHFGIRNKHRKDEGTKVDQLCYVGFGSPARLLPQATKKTLFVPTELECKAECSKARENTLLQCMSFSYRSNAPKGAPNCQLSDILQRDLLPNVDYVHDPDYWLFAWDNYSPECIRLSNEPVHGNTIGKEGIDGRYGWDTFHALDTWRVYSVSGWPCRRGSLCQQNREAGFWFCELEGGDKNSWDYCCRPDHQCGASDGYPYQWCYVGPAKTQWRKCSDRYYPYIHDVIEKVDISKLYLPPPQKPAWRPPYYRPGGRPDRPPAPPLDPPPTPSLDEYEKLFDNDFLDPPKPGGLARHWPVSYLHKEMPPNSTDSEPRLMRMEQPENPKLAAIQNLINVIKSNDLKNVQYHISNESNNSDDVLFVKIPLPTNFTEETRSRKRNTIQSNTSATLVPAYSKEGDDVQSKRSHKALPVDLTHPVDDKKGFPSEVHSYRGDTHRSSDGFHSGDTYRTAPVFRRGFVTRANSTQLQGRLAF